MKAVTEQVHFNVNLKTVERDGKWIAVTLQTGIITVGATELEAMDKAAEWNIFWVREAKANGYRALKECLDTRGITFRLESSKVPLELAAAATSRNVPFMTGVSETSGHVRKLAA